MVEMPLRLRLRSWSVLDAQLPEDAGLLRNCLDEMIAANPEDAAPVEYAD
jgi:hypothetical protein